MIEIAAMIDRLLPLGIEGTLDFVEIVLKARAEGRTHFSQADEDAFFAATGRTLTGAQ